MPDETNTMGRDSSQLPQRVIFLSSSVGAGHNQAAAAVMEALRLAEPSVPTEFADALGFVPGWHRLLYAGGYSLAVTKFPRLYGLGYRLMNRPVGRRRRWQERARLRLEWYVLRRLRRFVLARLPALVMATHYLAMPAVGRLVRQGTPGVRLWAVVTDNESHRFWYAEDVERWFVANEQVVGELGRWGVEPGRVTVSGIPVHPKWTAPLDRQSICRDWKLPADRPIVLLSGGAFFTVGPVAEMARAILSSCDAHVVVLAGSNKRLLARLASLPEAGTRLTPVPFTDRVHELAEVACLMVTKAGGLTTTECTAKGLAMVLTPPVPGQEAANARWLARHGAAVVTRSAEEVVARVAELLASPGRLESLRAAARRLYRPAARTIAEEIIKSLRHADRQ